MHFSESVIERPISVVCRHRRSHQFTWESATAMHNAVDGELGLGFRSASVSKCPFFAMAEGQLQPSSKLAHPSYPQPFLALSPSHPVVSTTLSLSRAMPLSLDLLVLSELVSSCGRDGAQSAHHVDHRRPSWRRRRRHCTSCTPFCTDRQIATTLSRDRFPSLLLPSF